VTDPVAPSIVKASAALARAQAAWIAAMEPWRGLGYQPSALGRWLARAAGQGQVWIALARAGSRRQQPVQGIIVTQEGFLLGTFVALLAVRPEQSGRGVGRALVQHMSARTFAKRRWLYVSYDSKNRPAQRFYRRLGFTRVGTLPDLIKPGHVELLLRKQRPSAVG
jgi:ribosomal protein S18 acetylase RimI-like enzyme